MQMNYLTLGGFELVFLLIFLYLYPLTPLLFSHTLNPIKQACYIANGTEVNKSRTVVYVKVMA